MQRNLKRRQGLPISWQLWLTTPLGNGGGGNRCAAVERDRFRHWSYLEPV
jgi:hypothetical protein